MNTLLLKITGMDCSACVMDIDGALEDEDGIHTVRTHFAKEQTEILFDPQRMNQKKIIEIIKNVGYEVTIIDVKH